MNQSSAIRGVAARSVSGILLGLALAALTACAPPPSGTTGSKPPETPAPSQPASEPAKPTASEPGKPATPAPTTPATDKGNPMTAVPVVKDPMPAKTQTAMFGAGCFWGVEGIFRKQPGVLATEVGFAGGHVKNVTYKQVCYTDTGHAEVVRVVFDPEKVSYDRLVDLFFKLHDPTQVNRQGPDIGTQYRTVIFFYGDEQKAVAEKKKAALEAAKKFKRPIATQIVAAPEFYRAEDYHQQYLEKTGRDSCHLPVMDDEEDAKPAIPAKP
ncbi:MAG: peptide-methionine (S)-S-oxide reductase MsrA [Phycisphaerales bacterium]|nr:peptide-methionine (S)-S-oxide reductase MsrA [Phycisphaerales bacterium]